MSEITQFPSNWHTLYSNLLGAWHHLSLWKLIGWHICFYINESLDSFAIMREMIEQLKVPVLFEPRHLHSAREIHAHENKTIPSENCL